MTGWIFPMSAWITKEVGFGKTAMWTMLGHGHQMSSMLNGANSISILNGQTSKCPFIILLGE